MNLEGAKKLDPPHLTPLKKRGDDGVCVLAGLFFLAVPVRNFLGSWEFGS